MIALCLEFGIWLVAIGMKGAGTLGGMIDKITEQNGISYFFWMFTFVSVLLEFYQL
jgi:proton-dependent oligopeptide transporter, POT family